MEELKNNCVPHEIMTGDFILPGTNKKEKDKIYNHDYYLKNKAYWKQTCLCECGLEYKRASKTKHMKTKEHLRRIVNMEMKLPVINLIDLVENIDLIESIEAISITIGKRTFCLK
jgi:hypothetical protein